MSASIAAALEGLDALEPHYQLVRTRTGRMDRLLLRVESVRTDIVLAENSCVVKESVGVTIGVELRVQCLAAERGARGRAATVATSASPRDHNGEPTC